MQATVVIPKGDTLTLTGGSRGKPALNTIKRPIKGVELLSHTRVKSNDLDSYRRSLL